MFSFHKPKVYRSAQGCCICKAKSSSSRFTDSKKYENDFIQCFQLNEPRYGEICNACVLLVKRFKRLPPGNQRHWSHVVDARIGPGIKSMTKFKKRKEEQQNEQNNEQFGKIMKKTKKIKAIRKVVKEDSPMRDDHSGPSSPGTSNSDVDDHKMDEYENDFNMEMSRRNRRKLRRPLKHFNRALLHESNILDAEFWMRMKTCCGFMYENKSLGALLVDVNEYSSSACPNHSKKLTAVKSISEDLRMPILKSLPPKKQHVLRHCLQDEAPIINNCTDDKVQSAPIDYSTATKVCHSAPNSRVASYLHKIKSDSGKIVKRTVKNLTPSKNKMTDLSAVKNLVKFCTDKAKKPTSNKSSTINAANSEHTSANEHNENVNTASVEGETATGKFSDSSSDSGYDESLHDAVQSNRIAKTVILSNGIKLHVQPENLLLAANLAGVSQSAIQSTQANMKAMNQQHLLLLQQGSSTIVENTVISPMLTQPNNKRVVSSDLKERTKKGVYIIKQNVLTVANNN